MGSKYATMWLKMSEQNMNMPEYVWIYDNVHGSEYVSHNTQHKVILQVSEYLLRDAHIQNPVKYLKQSTLEK